MCLKCDTGGETFCFCGTSMQESGGEEPCGCKADSSCSRCGHSAGPAIPMATDTLPSDFREFEL